jgi:hypothetical protein
MANLIPERLHIMWALSEDGDSSEEVNDDRLTSEKVDDTASDLSGAKQFVKQDHEGQSTTG